MCMGYYNYYLYYNIIKYNYLQIMAFLFKNQVSITCTNVLKDQCKK